VRSRIGSALFPTVRVSSVRNCFAPNVAFEEPACICFDNLDSGNGYKARPLLAQLVNATTEPTSPSGGPVFFGAAVPHARTVRQLTYTR
jgi:hypothetical protein